MTIQEFQEKSSDTHEAYSSGSASKVSSILAPVAPEYTTGEALMGAAYRALLLGIHDREVTLENLGNLPSQMGQAETWGPMFKSYDGLRSPTLRKQDPEQINLMPLVPEIARYACVLGAKADRRWNSGKFLLSAVHTGAGPARYAGVAEQLARALDVDQKDDLLARFIDSSLRGLSSYTRNPTRWNEHHGSGAWRSSQGSGAKTPAERLVDDLLAVSLLKDRLTRRQWTVLVETQLRLGQGMHALWLCSLNERLWGFVKDVISGTAPPTDQDLEQKCWLGHANEDPLLEIGRDGGASIKTRIQRYLVARIGLNLVLHALEDAGEPWSEAIGVPKGDSESPSQALGRFVRHVSKYAGSIGSAIKGSQLAAASIKEATTRLVDLKPEHAALESGHGKNMFEFVRHVLGQMETRDGDSRTYDQSYLLLREGVRSPLLVQPGPVTLILLVYNCCQEVGQQPASLDDFKAFLSGYGIYAPAGVLQSGAVARDLERLGLVVDTPDAGGGRLLVNPFQAWDSGHE